MKQVLAHVEEHKQKFAQLPLFQFLQDKSIDPRQRLALAPCLTPFVMNIWEVNKYVFRKEPTTDKLQAIINQHSYEDDHHFIWLLEDFEKLGINRSMKFNDVLRFVWGPETEKARRVCNVLTGLAYHAEPIMQLAIIEAIEATGNVFLSLTTDISRELYPITGESNYRYFGEHHLNVETGHTTGEDGIESFIESIELTPEQQVEACDLVDKVFAVFTDFINEMLVYAQTHSIDTPFTKIGSSTIEAQLPLEKVMDEDRELSEEYTLSSV